MNTIRFACPVCGQHIACDQSGKGMEIQCPGCNQTVIVPSVFVGVPLPQATDAPTPPPVMQTAREAVTTAAATGPAQSGDKPDVSWFCEKCGYELVAPYDQYGKSVQCSYCHQKTRLVQARKVPTRKRERTGTPTAQANQASKPSGFRKPGLLYLAFCSLVLGSILVRALYQPERAKDRKASTPGADAAFRERNGLDDPNASSKPSDHAKEDVALLKKLGFEPLTGSSTGNDWVHAQSDTRWAFCRSAAEVASDKLKGFDVGVPLSPQFFYDGIDNKVLKQGYVYSKLGDMVGKLILEAGEKHEEAARKAKETALEVARRE